MNNISQLPPRVILMVCACIILLSLIPSGSSLEVLISVLTLGLIVLLLREDFGTEMRNWLRLSLCTYGLGVIIDLADEIPELKHHWLIDSIDDIFMHIGIFLICFCLIKMLHQRHHLIEELHNQIAKASNLENELRRQALQDELTGVQNRRSLFQHFDQIAINLQRGILAYIDLDNFKQVNDRYGHGQGDQVLINIASVLTNTAPAGSQIYRIGGDEFVVMLASEEQAICYQWVDTLYEETTEIREQFNFDISIGLTPYYPGNLSDPDTILAKADAAMYKEKKLNR